MDIQRGFQRWFTLVELMIVVAVIWILAASLFPSIWNYMSRWRDTQRMTHLNNIAKALEAYKADKDIYPNNTICDAAAMASPPPINKAFCISTAGWDCWWTPEPSTLLNMCMKNKRLIGKEYLNTMPVDAKNFDDGIACNIWSQSWLYSYASENTSEWYVLTTRLENAVWNKRIWSYTGSNRIWCSGFANWGIVVNNGWYPIASWIVGQ